MACLLRLASLLRRRAAPVCLPPHGPPSSLLLSSFLLAGVSRHWICSVVEQKCPSFKAGVSLFLSTAAGGGAPERSGSGREEGSVGSSRQEASKARDSSLHLGSREEKEGEEEESSIGRMALTKTKREHGHDRHGDPEASSPFSPSSFSSSSSSSVAPSVPLKGSFTPTGKKQRWQTEALKYAETLRQYDNRVSQR